MSRPATRALAREALRLTAALLAGSAVAGLILGLLAWSPADAALAFGGTLAITLTAGLPTYLSFRLFGPLTMRRAMLAGAIVALAPAVAATAWDRLYDVAPPDADISVTLLGAVIMAMLGAMGGCGFYLGYRTLFQSRTEAGGG